MIFTNEVLIRSIILILGVFGFFVAKHIYNHKTKNTPLVCMVGFDCHTVVHSDYSRFLGIRVEILGMMYYVFIALSYTALFFLPNFFPMMTAQDGLTPDTVLMFIKMLPFLSLIAFIFSVYLIAVQIFILKKGCSWCIVSALISTIIFVLALFI